MAASAFSDALKTMNPLVSARQINGAGRNPSMIFVKLRLTEIPEHIISKSKLQNPDHRSTIYDGGLSQKQCLNLVYDHLVPFADTL
jgi:hypothetical protein